MPCGVNLFFLKDLDFSQISFYTHTCSMDGFFIWKYEYVVVQ